MQKNKNKENKEFFIKEIIKMNEDISLFDLKKKTSNISHFNGW